MNIIETLAEQVIAGVKARLGGMVEEAVREALGIAKGNGAVPAVAAPLALLPPLAIKKRVYVRSTAPQSLAAKQAERDKRRADILLAVQTPKTLKQVADELGLHAPGVASTLYYMQKKQGWVKQQGDTFQVTARAPKPA